MLRNFHLALWILVLLLLVIAAGIFFLLTQGLPGQQENGTGISVEKTSRAEELPQTAEELAALTWQTPEVRTNLESGNLVLVQFALQVSEEEAVEELEIRHPQVSDAIIRLVQEMSKEDFLQKDGLLRLQEQLQEETGQFLQSGEVVQVYTVQKVVQ